jgi:monoterpene epsilon-lactone hydrolase
MAAYRLVVSTLRSEDIVAAGASAGGNLAAAMLLRAREEGLPLPAGLLLTTPVVDMTGAGDTRETNRFHDVNLFGGADEGLNAYAGNADREQPCLSPINGDLAAGWPPTLLSSGTRDLLLSDTVRFHPSCEGRGFKPSFILQKSALMAALWVLRPKITN